MTEYKKLVSLVDTLKENVEVLYAQHDASNDANEEAGSPSTDALFSVASAVGAAVGNGAPRIAKIVARARETDPNRQIYSEMMCGKIEDLFDSFVAAVYRLLYESPLERRAQTNVKDDENQGDELADEREEAVRAAVLEGRSLLLEDSAVLADIERKHDAELLRRAAAEAWAGRVAEDLSQLILFEHQSRQVLEAEEKQNRTSLVEKKQRDKGMVLGILQLLADAKLGVEMTRRAKEKAWLAEAAKHVKVDGLVGFLPRAFPTLRCAVALLNTSERCARRCC
ncbi:uncharacterized protein LOC126767091 [Bactrocera neohumeralis]|uniref:uncharacterized protein LOC126767091 n=1 Tax=Bactrocera neohumeralis TaxID=98809 RepID=UPI002166BB4C|nr:uncharacterized protein LOC126767091 [Bactrocera neohumeralis]